MTFHIQGRCQLMCPLSEVKRRQEKGMIHLMEKKNSGKEVDESKMIKEYVRPSYRSRPFQSEEIRTPETLLLTTEYLINQVANSKEHPWQVVYDFISDRLRAIRQELVLQNIDGTIRIKIMEYCTLFHLYSSYRLCNLKSDQFSDVLNIRWLRECMAQLLTSYNECVDDDLNTNRVIFECVYLLIDLGCIEAISRYNLLPQYIQQHQRYRECLKVNFLYHQKNYFALLHSFTETCTLFKIAANLRLFEVIESYFQILSFSCSSPSQCAITYSHLARVLRPYSDETGIDFVEWIKQNVAKDRVAEIDDKMIKFCRNLYHPRVIHRRKWKCVDAALGNNVDLIGLLADIK